MQVLAHKLLPDEWMCSLYSRIVLKKHINLREPTTFNEKIQWLKIHAFPYDPLVVQCADKYAVRDYVRAKGLENTLTPLLGDWLHARDIDWDTLPEQFVLKCNHGCAYNLVCTDKSRFDGKRASIQLERWLQEDFGAYNIELHYSKIRPHRILCEEFLGDRITDYKFFCFHGVPKFLYVSRDLIHDRQAEIGFFYPDGSRMEMKRTDYKEISAVEFPTFYPQMMEDARILSADFAFVRVDFFLTDDRYYFAELTFTPGAGMMPFDPESYDAEWGALLDISETVRKHES